MEDMAELVQSFVDKSAASVGRRITGIEDDALALLKSHDWPGNVRELQHCVESAVVLAEFDLLTEEDFQIYSRGKESVRLETPNLLRPQAMKVSKAMGDLGEGMGSSARSFRSNEESRQKTELIQSIRQAKGNKSEAARIMGIPRSTLVSQLKKFGLD
jgi:DNA-binding NtrC family response regulator